jgi:hypothetical protein
MSSFWSQFTPKCKETSASTVLILFSALCTEAPAQTINAKVNRTSLGVDGNQMQQAEFNATDRSIPTPGSIGELRLVDLNSNDAMRL